MEFTTFSKQQQREKKKLSLPVMTSVRVNNNYWRYLCENN